MAEKHLFPEWRNQQTESKYPFADIATLTNGADVIPPSLFADARLFVIGGGARQFLSRISVGIDSVAIFISDESEEVIAVGELDFINVGETIALFDAFGRPAGVLVSTIEQFATLASWSAGDHDFTIAQTEFTATVVVPQPQIGVRGFVAEGKLFAGDVYLVGEQGVFLTLDGEFIRVDIVGDPRSRQRFCEQLFSFEQPWFVRTINKHAPDEFGDFKILAGAQLASDTVLRIETQPAGLGFKLIGNVVTNAPE